MYTIKIRIRGKTRYLRFARLMSAITSYSRCLTLNPDDLLLIDFDGSIISRYKYYDKVTRSFKKCEVKNGI